MHSWILFQIRAEGEIAVLIQIHLQTVKIRVPVYQVAVGIALDDPCNFYFLSFGVQNNRLMGCVCQGKLCFKCFLLAGKRNLTPESPFRRETPPETDRLHSMEDCVR